MSNRRLERGTFPTSGTAYPRSDALVLGVDENRGKLARGPKDEGGHSVEGICAMLGVVKSMLCRCFGEDDGGSDRR